MKDDLMKVAGVFLAGAGFLASVVQLMDSRDNRNWAFMMLAIFIFALGFYLIYLWWKPNSPLPDNIPENYKMEFATEEDIYWISKLEVKFYSKKDVVPVETLISWHKRNNKTFIIIKGKITNNRFGYLDILPLRPTTLRKFIDGKDFDVTDIKPNGIFKVEDKESVEDIYMDSIIIDLPNKYKSATAFGYVLRHIPKFLAEICNFDNIKNVYAIAATPKGSSALEDLKFTKIKDGKKDNRKDNDDLYVANFQKLRQNRLFGFDKANKNSSNGPT